MSYTGGAGQGYGYNPGYGHPAYYQQQQHQQQQQPQRPQQPSPQQQASPCPPQYAAPQQQQMRSIPQQIPQRNDQYLQQAQVQHQNQAAFYPPAQYSSNQYPTQHQNYYHSPQPQAQPLQFYPQYANFSQPAPQLQPIQPIQPMQSMHHQPHVQQYPSPQQHVQMTPQRPQPSPKINPSPQAATARSSFSQPTPAPVPVSAPAPPTIPAIKQTPILPPIRKSSSTMAITTPIQNATPPSRPRSTPQPVSQPREAAKKPGPVIDSKSLIALAEEFFAEAGRLAAHAASHMDEKALDTYHRLMSTGLGCLQSCILNIELRPRMQASIRLRYAAVLFEETENYAEAEETLTKGILICERHNFVDLKYSMQFLQAKILFASKPKAGFKLLDNTIIDAEAYRHHAWVYAFRFLRAFLSMSLGTNSATHSAISNLRSIAALASQKGDKAIFSMASLFEVIAHLSATGAESTENAKRALATALTYQLDQSSKIPQISCLTHTLDVICSFLFGQPGEGAAKLRDLQIMMDSAKDDPTWTAMGSVLAVPISVDSAAIQTVSQDTRAVLDVSNDGRNLLMLSFLNLKDAMALTNLLSAIVLLLKDSIEPHKASQYLRQTHLYLTESKKVRKSGTSLIAVQSALNWRRVISTYCHIYQAFCFAIRTEWAECRKHLAEVERSLPTLEDKTAPFDHFFLYLNGVCYQGTGELDAALRMYKDPILALQSGERASLTPSNRAKQDLTILALLNSIWISQQASRQDPTKVSADVARLEPLCVHHPDQEIRTAYDLVMATVITDPPSSNITQKNYIRSALNRANATQNAQFLSMVFSIMCSKFFNGVVGAQAMKSATTATLYAKRSGSVLWQSVAEGLLAQTHETHGDALEAQMAAQKASTLANMAFGKPV